MTKHTEDVSKVPLAFYRIMPFPLKLAVCTGIFPTSLPDPSKYAFFRTCRNKYLLQTRRGNFAFGNASIMGEGPLGTSI